MLTRVVSNFSSVILVLCLRVPVLFHSELNALRDVGQDCLYSDFIELFVLFIYLVFVMLGVHITAFCGGHKTTCFMILNNVCLSQVAAGGGQQAEKTHGGSWESGVGWWLHVVTSGR